MCLNDDYTPLHCEPIAAHPSGPAACAYSEDYTPLQRRLYSARM